MICWTVELLSKTLKIKTSKIRKMLDDGTLKGEKEGDEWLIPQESVSKFCKAMQIPVPQPMVEYIESKMRPQMKGGNITWMPPYDIRWANRIIDEYEQGHLVPIEWIKKWFEESNSRIYAEKMTMDWRKENLL